MPQLLGLGVKAWCYRRRFECPGGAVPGGGIAALPLRGGRMSASPGHLGEAWVFAVLPAVFPFYENRFG